MSPMANIPQAQFLGMKNKFRGFVAGFGSGKTWVGCQAKCIHYLEHPKVNQGYFAPTYSHIRDIFYPTMEEVAESFGFRIEIKRADKEVNFYRGNKYHGTTICRSLDRPELIVGYKIGHGLVDELDILPMDKAQTAWRKMIARLRWDGVKNGLDISTTPEGFRFVYRQFVEEVQKHPEKAANYGLIQASTHDNAANLPEDYIPSLLEAYPEELINAYVDGQFVNLTSGTVYSAYNRAQHRSRESVKAEELLRIGMDFNVTNMSAVVYVLRGEKGNQWHAVAELKGIYDTPAMITTIKELFPGHSIRVYPDASGKSRKTVNASISDISLLEAAGFAVYANASNPLVKDRVIATNLAFTKGLLYINDDKCQETAKCFEQLAYDKNGEPDKSSNLDHLPDAGTYPIAFEMPVVRPAANLNVRFSR